MLQHGLTVIRICDQAEELMRIQSHFAKLFGILKKFNFISILCKLLSEFLIFRRLLVCLTLLVLMRLVLFSDFSCWFGIFLFGFGTGRCTRRLIDLRWGSCLLLDIVLSHELGALQKVMAFLAPVKKQRLGNDSVVRDHGFIENVHLKWQNVSLQCFPLRFARHHSLMYFLQRHYFFHC